MKTKVLLTSTLICFFIPSGYSQVTQEWVARYNGPPGVQDYAYSITVDGPGNVYVTGESVDFVGGPDYATIKYNSSGVQQWVARYNGGFADNANSIKVDGTGNVYVTGGSIGNVTGYDYATIKYSSSGVQQWASRYNGPENDFDEARSLAVDGSGNVYVTGVSTGGTGYDYATVKYNSSGVQQWVARYNGPGGTDDGAYSIAVDGSGNVYVTGESEGSVTSFDYATIKYNSSGDSLWVRRYNGPGNIDDGALSIVLDSSGNVYVTGYSTGSGTGYDYATIKYNSSGVQQWVTRYNGPVNDEVDIARSMALDGLGNVYVTGQSWGNGTSSDYATVKYNSAGVQQWASRYNGPGNDLDRAYSIALDPLSSGGNVYVTGGSYGIFEDYATIKYNSSGVQQWVVRYNGPGNGSDYASSIGLDGSGNVYVTGTSHGGSGATYDYATIKYSQPVGIQPISNEIPGEYNLYQNYPNPFNPNSKIKFQISKLRDVKLSVFDILGREIVTLVNEALKPGTYEAEFSGENYPSGIYFYRLQTEAFNETLKMSLIK
jgi:hypothetical protein